MRVYVRLSTMILVCTFLLVGCYAFVDNSTKNDDDDDSDQPSCTEDSDCLDDEECDHGACIGIWMEPEDVIGSWRWEFVEATDLPDDICPVDFVSYAVLIGASINGIVEKESGFYRVYYTKDVFMDLVPADRGRFTMGVNDNSNALELDFTDWFYKMSGIFNVFFYHGDEGEMLKLNGYFTFSADDPQLPFLDNMREILLINGSFDQKDWLTRIIGSFPCSAPLSAKGVKISDNTNKDGLMQLSFTLPELGIEEPGDMITSCAEQSISSECSGNRAAIALTGAFKSRQELIPTDNQCRNPEDFFFWKPYPRTDGLFWYETDVAGKIVINSLGDDENAVGELCDDGTFSACGVIPMKYAADGTILSLDYVVSFSGTIDLETGTPIDKINQTVLGIYKDGLLYPDAAAGDLVCRNEIVISEFINFEGMPAAK